MYIYLSTYLPIYLSIFLSIYLSIVYLYSSRKASRPQLCEWLRHDSGLKLMKLDAARCIRWNSSNPSRRSRALWSLARLKDGDAANANNCACQHPAPHRDSSSASNLFSLQHWHHWHLSVHSLRSMPMGANGSTTDRTGLFQFLSALLEVRPHPRHGKYHLMLLILRRLGLFLWTLVSKRLHAALLSAP